MYIMSIIMRKYGLEFVTTVSCVYLQYELGILRGLGWSQPPSVLVMNQKQFKPLLHWIRSIKDKLDFTFKLVAVRYKANLTI